MSIIKMVPDAVLRNRRLGIYVGKRRCFESLEISMCRCKDRIRGKDENESACTHCSWEQTVNTLADDFVDIAYRAEKTSVSSLPDFKGTHIFVEVGRRNDNR